MNNYGFKRNRNADYLNGLRVPLSNSNHLIYSRQSSNNQIDSSSPSTSNPSVQSPNRHSINICNNLLQARDQAREQLPNRSNVLVEVHSPSEPQENKAKSVERLNSGNQQAASNVNRHLTFTKNQQITKDEITQLNAMNGMNGDRRQSTSSEENSLNDQNLNCQLQARRKSSIPNGRTETELNDKTKRLRRYSEKDKELNLPLLNQKPYHEYDQPSNLIYDQSMNCCQNHLLNSNSLNIRKASCNCNQRAMNGFNGLNHIENGEDDERRSLV